MSGVWRLNVLAAGLAFAVLPVPVAGAAQSRTEQARLALARIGISVTRSTTTPYTPCPPGAHMIECNIVVDPPAVKVASGYRPARGGALYEGNGVEGGFDPANLQSAYKIPTTGGSGVTVAIVDAYGYSAAESDLAKYRKEYGLSECTKTNGCFKKVNEKGEEKNYPAEGGELEVSWTLESALDMDMVSAACSGCKILLVEASTQEPAKTAASVEEAAKLGAAVISNSYGYPEKDETFCPSKKGCSEYLSAYKQAGIPVVVSSGDSGYDDHLTGWESPNWPASSPNVIAVGGTSLKKAENTRGWTETVWEGSGSGCSIYESKPAWQHDKGCTNRTDNDVAAVADPATPVSIYNTPYAKGWDNVGGTSVGAPLIAGIEGLAEKPAKELGAEIFYDQPTSEFAVTKGSNGSCEISYLCTAGEGYNAPAGLGALDGVPNALPIAEDTSPSAALEPSTGDPSIYYVDRKHEIAYWTYTTSGWTNGVIGGSVEADTSPTAIYDSTDKEAFIYFVNKSGEIDMWGKTTGAWAEFLLGGSVESGTSPSAFDVGGEVHVAYINASKEVAEWRYGYGGPWADTTLGGSVEAGTSPSAIYDSTDNEMLVYFVNKSGEIDTWGKTTGAWAEYLLGGSVESGTSPSAFDVGSELRVYYAEQDEEIAEWRYGGPWMNATL